LEIEGDAPWQPGNKTVINLRSQSSDIRNQIQSQYQEKRTFRKIQPSSGKNKTTKRLKVVVGHH